MNTAVKEVQVIKATITGEKTEKIRKNKEKMYAQPLGAWASRPRSVASFPS